MQTAVIVMTRIPAAGFTKTRLVGRLSNKECAALHSACLWDICSLLISLGWPAYISFTGTSTEEGLNKEQLEQKCGLHPGLLGSFEIMEQEGNDLGERMLNSFNHVLEHYPAAIILGSDLPQLAIMTLRKAARLLEDNDIVLGPCTDGGYYLLGVKNSYPFLFHNIPWGSDQVLQLTRERAQNHRLSLAQLQEARDLDRWEDLLHFMEQTAVENRLNGLHSYRYISRLQVIRKALGKGNLNECRDKADL